MTGTLDNEVTRLMPDDKVTNSDLLHRSPATAIWPPSDRADPNSASGNSAPLAKRRGARVSKPPSGTIPIQEAVQFQTKLSAGLEFGIHPAWLATLAS